MVDLIQLTFDMSTKDQVKDLVKVNNLVKHYPVRGGIMKRVVAWVQAIDGVSFTIREGETLGLVRGIRMWIEHSRQLRFAFN